MLILLYYLNIEYIDVGNAMQLKKRTKSILSELFDDSKAQSFDDLENRIGHTISSMINMINSFDDLDISEEDKQGLIKWVMLGIKNQSLNKHQKYIEYLKQKYEAD